MIELSGAVPFVIIVAMVFTWLGSYLIARKYKAKILSLMLGGDSPKDESSSVHVSATTHSRVPDRPFASLKNQNKRARRNYNLVIIFLSFFISLLISLLVVRIATPDDAFSFRRNLLVLLANAWPMVPCLGLLARWSYLKIVALSVAYTAVVCLIVLLNSVEGSSILGIVVWLFGSQIPLFVSIILLLGPKLRTLGPYLLIVFSTLISASVVSLTMLNQSLIDDDLNSWIIDLAELSSAYFVFTLFIVLPWLFAFFLLRAFARYASKAYAQKAFSEPLYLISCIWFFVLLFQSISLSFDIGLWAYALLLGVLIIPLMFFVLKSFLIPRHPPPTLLLLRVFREDDGIGLIFDNVLERWRFSGNTVMIGGKDLAIRTLEPDELFNFLNGDLERQFISGESKLREGVSRLDLKPDPDGRFRINEFFCFDTTWKPALNALVSKAEFVLMDLRDYHAGRQGCSYELKVLAGSPHIQKIVMVANHKTDIETATRLLGSKASETIWVRQTKTKDRSLENRMLTSLLE